MLSIYQVRGESGFSSGMTTGSNGRLSVRGPGEHFGEVALLAGATRTANVESIAETTPHCVSQRTI